MLGGRLSAPATEAERAESRPGDELVDADVVMDTAFTLSAQPDVVWPWIVQLGKARAGWYLPRSVERFLPASRRAARSVDPRWQDLAVGDVIPDYGGSSATFDVVEMAAPSTIVYHSVRGRLVMTWSIVLRDRGDSTRVLLRVRLGNVRRRRLAQTVGGAFDGLTIAGLAAGLRERVRPSG